jgi:hypothetical protein
VGDGGGDEKEEGEEEDGQDDDDDDKEEEEEEEEEEDDDDAPGGLSLGSRLPVRTAAGMVSLGGAVTLLILRHLPGLDHSETGWALRR